MKKQKEFTISFNGYLLTGLLIFLKLFGTITWNWWIVLAPLYVMWVLQSLFFLLGLAFLGLANKYGLKIENKDFK